jgi:hypothetical protein
VVGRYEVDAVVHSEQSGVFCTLEGVIEELASLVVTPPQSYSQAIDKAKYCIYSSSSKK